MTTNRSAGRADEPEPELRRILRIVGERKRVVLAALVAGGAMFACWAAMSPRVYEATATVVADASPPRVLGQEVRDVIDVGPGQYLLMQDYIQTQRRVLTSGTLARRAIHALKVENDLGFWQELEQPVSRRRPPTEEEEVRAFVRAITVEALPRTQIINVTFRHRRPEVAKRAVDALVDCFLDHNLEQHDTTTHSASRWLTDEADVLRKGLAASELALYEFRSKNDLLSLSVEDRINNQTQRIDKLGSALTDVRLRRVARAAEAEQLLKMVTADASSLPLPADAPGAGTLEALKKDLLDEERKLNELQSRYEDPHPFVRHQAAKLQTVRAAIAREIAVQLRAARSRTDEASTEERQIAQQLDQANREGLRVARLELDYKKLKRETDGLARQYGIVANRTKETELSSKIRENNLHVLDYAALPDRPRSPRLTMGAGVALALALLIGLGLALLLDGLDRTLKTQSDVENKLGLPLLGIVPRIAKGAELTVIEGRVSIAAEYLRMIRTSLLFAGVSKKMHRVLITSSAAAEGKTLTAINLAAVVAQAGGRVLLVDCDLRRPTLKAAFGLNGDVGLMSVVLGTATLEEAIRPTSVPNLFVLPCGPLPPDPAELIARPRFLEVLDQCGQRFDQVFIDSPPAGPVTDPALLADACDGIILVTRAGRTTLDQLRRAEHNLGECSAPIVGVILNDVELSDQAYGYRYRPDNEGEREREWKGRRAAQ